MHERGGIFIQVSSRLPYDAARYPDADAVLLCYGNRGMTEMPGSSEATPIYGPNIPAAIYTVFGGNTPSGKLPVAVPQLNDDYTYSDETLYERGFGLEGY